MKRPIILQTPGIRIRAEGDALVIPEGTKLRRILFRNIQYIVISRGISLSSDVLFKAATNDVFVFIADFDGEITGVYYPAGFSGNILLQREQVKAYYDERGVHLAKIWASASIETKARLLRYLGENRKGTGIGKELIEISNEIMEYLRDIEKLEGDIDTIRKDLMIAEAYAGEKYFSALAKIIPPKYGFTGVRTRRPPRDMANATISYANSIVREKILYYVLISGLNPFFGFLHADRPKRKSLVLDISEEFIVPVSHLAAITLMVRKKLRETDFVRVGEGIYLDYGGRIKVRYQIETILQRKIRGKTINKIILNQIQNLVEHLKNQKTYKPATIDF